MIKFGPAGLGEKIGNVAESFEDYHKKGLAACEIPFTYGVFIKEEIHKKEIGEIREASKNFGIQLSIHAPYFVNLNSMEKEKVEASKKRILDCCKIGHLIGAKNIVFHAGFYGKMDREQSYQNIKREVLELMAEVKKNGWDVRLCPETMGKINVFGSADEILKLVRETGCGFCVDFAHLWAREQGKITYEEIYSKFRGFDELHCHFSGITFGEKGELSHKPTPDEEIRKLLSALPRNKEIVIINEAPEPIKDSVRMLKIFRGS